MLCKDNNGKDGTENGNFPFLCEFNFCKHNSYLSTRDGIGIGNHPYEPCPQDKSHWHKDLNHKVAASSDNGGLQNLEDTCTGIRL